RDDDRRAGRRACPARATSARPTRFSPSLPAAPDRSRAAARPARAPAARLQPAALTPWWSHVERPAIDPPEPALRDPADEPEAHDHEREPGDQQADAEREHHEGQAERDPEQSPPERANLPPEVRLEPCPARLAALHVVQDDGDDRRPAREEREHDRRRGDDPG